MDTKKLKKEEMDAIRELSGIQLQVSKGRATLSEIKENVADYLVERKEAVEKEIKKVFEKSKTLINQINKNYLEVKAYHNETKGFVGELIAMSEGLRATKELFDTYMSQEKKKITERTQELSDIEKELKEKEEQIIKDRELFNNEKEELKKAQIQVDDQRATLNRAFERIK